MTIVEYVEVVRAYRIARGRMKYFRDSAQALAEALRHDLTGLRMKQSDGGFREEYPEEPVDGVSLGSWPTGDEILAGIHQLRQARQVVEAAWETLTDDERAAVVDPQDI